METEENFKGEAIRYWEIRRIFWNLLLVPPALLSYFLAAGIVIGIGDEAAFGWPIVATSFCFSVVGANICYSFAYVIEFWIQGSLAGEGYRRSGRNTLFILGCLLGVGLALTGGASIAQAQYPLFPN